MASAAALAIAGALPPGAFAQEPDPYADPTGEMPEALRELLFESNAEYIGSGVTKSISKELRAEINEDIASGELSGSWASPKNHVDYRHFNEEFEPAVFPLTHEALALAIRHNFLATASEISGEETILFGLRGCSHEDGSQSKSGESISLRESRPDHKTFNCIIGVWKPAQRHLTTFRASTVPNLLHLQAYARGPAKHGASMLPTGRHVYAVGTHKRDSGENIAAGKLAPGQQPGALLLAKATPVLRLTDKTSPMVFTLENQKMAWDTTAGNTSLNMHAGDGDKAPLKFSSAGCQVIQGQYNLTGAKEGLPYGDWGRFRKALGLTDVFVERSVTMGGKTYGGRQAAAGEEGKRFSYYLLTGHDLRLFSALAAAQGANAIAKNMMRLRFGSRGAAVTALNRAMQRQPNSSVAEIDVAYFRRVVGIQASRSKPDGIITPAFAAEYQVDLSQHYSA